MAQQEREARVGSGQGPAIPPPPPLVTEASVPEAPAEPVVEAVVEAQPVAAEAPAEG